MPVIETQTERTQIDPGFYHNVDFATYARWDAINWHTLEPYRRSPLHGRWAELMDLEATDAMIDGEAFHSAILEPERFARDYAVMPAFEGHHNSKIYKEARAAWLEEHRGQVDIDADGFTDLQAAQAAVRNHPVAGNIMAAGGRTEIGIVWEFGGVLLKARIDTVRRVPAALIDLTANAGATCIVQADFKTTRAIGTRLINSEIAKHGYGAQLAMQYDGLRAIRPADVVPMLIAVCKPPKPSDRGPWDVVVCDMRPRLDAGRALYQRLLKKYLACRKAQRWPGVAEHVIPMNPLRYEVDPNEMDAEIGESDNDSNGAL